MISGTLDIDLEQALETNRRLNARVGELERALRVAQGEAKMLRDTCPYRAELEDIATRANTPDDRADIALRAIVRRATAILDSGRKP